jgi:hypothetical protein
MAVSRQTVVKIEGGLEPPPTTVRMAGALNVEPADLMAPNQASGMIAMTCARTEVVTRENSAYLAFDLPRVRHANLTRPRRFSAPRPTSTGGATAQSPTRSPARGHWPDIVALEQLAGQLERGVPDEWESAQPRGIEPPEDE